MKKMNTALSGNKKKSNKKVDGFLKFRFGLKYRLNLYERLAAFTKEEFPLFDSLQKFKNRYDKKKDFLEMWEVLFQLYSSLRNQLAEKNQAYEGMIFRDVIDSFSKNPVLMRVLNMVIYSSGVMVL